MYPVFFFLISRSVLSFLRRVPYLSFSRKCWRVHGCVHMCLLYFKFWSLRFGVNSYFRLNGCSFSPDLDITKVIVAWFQKVARFHSKKIKIFFKKIEHLQLKLNLMYDRLLLITIIKSPGYHPNKKYESTITLVGVGKGDAFFWVAGAKWRYPSELSSNFSVF